MGAAAPPLQSASSFFLFARVSAGALSFSVNTETHFHVKKTSKNPVLTNPCACSG